MKKSTTTRRKIGAIFLNIIFLHTLFYPSFSWATNNGPHAPEFTSFEPVDATDMVNLSTGDFSYVLPLMEVPGPSGGYPISLSYHGGIGLEQEASWAGLGWTVNPGAINRGINGTPDDWAEAVISDFQFNPGKITDLVNVSSSIQIPGKVGFSIGQSWKNGQANGGVVGVNYAGVSAALGTGARNYASVGVGLKLSHNLNLGVSASTSNGESQYSVGLSSLSGQASVGASFSSEGINATVGIGSKSISMLSEKVSVNDWTLNTYIDSRVNVDLIVAGFTYGRNKFSHSLFKETDNYVKGALYLKGDHIQNKEKDNFAGQHAFNSFMDVYDSPGVLDLTKTTIRDPFFTTTLGQQDRFQFVAYDNYNVSGQGINGSIQPKRFEYGNLIYKRNVLRYQTSSGNTSVPELEEQYMYNSSSGTGLNNRKFNKSAEDVHFYFNGAYGGELKVKAANIVNTGGNLPIWSYSSTASQQHSGPYNSSTNRRGTGKVVEWFSNSQIVNQLSVSQSRGFIETISSLNRSSLPKDGIGSYTVTVEDGKKYHYSLPVYNLVEISQMSNKENFSDYQSFTTKFTPFATQWLLTTITGSDYIDVNSNGIADKGDYGYWVNFDYGKWNDGYVYGDPYSGATKSQRNYYKSTGVKEVYYLDAIQTATHTALFIKDRRKDGKGIEKSIRVDFDKQIGNTKESGIGKDSPLYHHFNSTSGSHSGDNYNTGADMHRYDFWKRVKLEVKNKAEGLYLKKVVLLDNKDLNYSSLKNNPTIGANDHIAGTNILNYSVVFLKAYRVPPGPNGGSSGTWNDYANNPPEYYHDVVNKGYVNHKIRNILDVADYGLANVSDKVIKAIDLNYDYSLAQNSENSSSTSSIDKGVKGRLTLKSIQYLGKEEIRITPPYKFDYYNLGNYNKEYLDGWGYYCKDINSGVFDKDKKDKTQVHNWSLKEVTFPEGAKMNIEYESDRYDYEAARCQQFYKAVPTGKEHLFKVSENHLQSVPINNFVLLGTENGYGGGIRTKSITVTDNQKSYKTTYNYSQGSTSFSPSRYNDGYLTNVHVKDGDNFTNEDIKKRGYYPANYVFVSGLEGNINFIPYKSELPSPQVIYGRVEVSSLGENGKSKGKTLYEFDNLAKTQNCDNSDNQFVLRKASINNPGYFLKIETGQKQKLAEYGASNKRDKVVAKSYTIHNRLGEIGMLSGVTKYNGQGEIVGRKTTNYGALNVATQETYPTIKRFIKRNGADYWTTFYHINSSKVEYKIPVVYQTTTIEGTDMTRIEYRDHDELTGQPLKSYYSNSFDEWYETNMIPAYKNYAGMGPTYLSASNKNMLSQESGSQLYYLGDRSNTTDKRIISSTATTWKNNWDYRQVSGGKHVWQNQPSGHRVWRKHETYHWQSLLNDEKDGTVTNKLSSGEKYVAFNYSNLAANNQAHWKKDVEIKHYDHYSRPVESIDINENYAVSYFAPDNRMTYSSTGGNLNEMAYSGAESIENNTYLDGEVKIGEGTRMMNSSAAHTGNYGVYLAPNQKTFKVNKSVGTNGDLKLKTYLADVWVKKVNPASEAKLYYQPNVGNKVYSTSKLITAGNWELHQFYIPINQLSGVNSIEIGVENTSGTAVYVDDFRLKPVSGAFTSYVYNTDGSLSAILDQNHIGTRYEYDQAGRFTGVYREIANKAEYPGGFVKIQESRMNYGNQ